MAWYKKFQRRMTLSLLSSATATALLRRSESAVLSAFRRAADDVPAYKQLLSSQAVDTASVKTIDDFRRLCPLLNKDNTFGRFKLSQLCHSGDIGDLSGVLTSSGHGARFGFGLSTRAQAKGTTDAVDLGLEYAFGVDNNKTLLINCLPMGVRFSSNSVTVAEVSVREDMAVALATEFGEYFDQIIFVGDPLFFKLMTDYARDRGVDWQRHRIHLIIGEETFGENYRDYLAAQFHLAPDDAASGMIGSSMGVGELGLNLFYETADTIRLRRLAHRNADFFAELFGGSSDGKPLPMLFVYNPLRCYVESLARDADGYGDLTISMLDPHAALPMLRYQTGDIARLILTESILAACERAGIEPPQNMALPMIALKGRAKDQLPGGGHVGVFKDALYKNHDIAIKLTGAFRLEHRGDRLQVHVQLRRGFAADAGMQSEMASVLPGPMQPAQVRLWTYEQFPFGMTLDYERKFNYLAR